MARNAHRGDPTDHAPNVDRLLEANSGPRRVNPDQSATHRRRAPVEHHLRLKAVKITDEAAAIFREIDEPDES